MPNGFSYTPASWIRRWPVVLVIPGSSKPSIQQLFGGIRFCSPVRKYRELLLSLDVGVGVNHTLNFYVNTIVAGYYGIPSGVCPTVRPCSPFPIDNLSIHSHNFFDFWVHIVIEDVCDFVNGQNRSFLKELLE